MCARGGVCVCARAGDEERADDMVEGGGRPRVGRCRRGGALLRVRSLLRGLAPPRSTTLLRCCALRLIVIEQLAEHGAKARQALVERCGHGAIARVATPRAALTAALTAALPAAARAAASEQPVPCQRNHLIQHGPAGLPAWPASAEDRARATARLPPDGLEEGCADGEGRLATEAARLRQREREREGAAQQAQREGDCLWAATARKDAQRCESLVPREVPHRRLAAADREEEREERADHALRLLLLRRRRLLPRLLPRLLRGIGGRGWQLGRGASAGETRSLVREAHQLRGEEAEQALLSTEAGLKWRADGCGAPPGAGAWSGVRLAPLPCPAKEVRTRCS